MFFAVLTLLCAACGAAEYRLSPEREALVQTMSQMPGYIGMLKEMSKTVKSGQYPELRAAVDRLRRTIRIARGESRCFKTGTDFGWKVRALEMDYKSFVDSISKVQNCDIPFLIDDMEAIPLALDHSLKPALALNAVKKSSAAPAAMPAQVPPAIASAAVSAPPAPVPVQKAAEPSFIGPQPAPSDTSVADIKNALAAFRSAVDNYAKNNPGKNIVDIAVLKPSYVTEIPVLKLPGREASSSVMVISNDSFPPDIGPALSNDGGWAVIGDRNSPRFGKVLINSTDKSPEGKSWYEY
ncbi:MAG: hypothetical protein WCS77_06320 [Elusimicrobiaceae bacterium]